MRPRAIIALTIFGILFAAAMARAGELPLQAACRIQCQDDDGGLSLGSGTLVNVRDGRGLVITNAHVVRDSSRGPYYVSMHNGATYGALLVDSDPTLDLAALEIRDPGVEPAAIAGSSAGETLTALGYGGGVFAELAGRPAKKYVAGAQRSIAVDRPFRDGDSGAGLFNERGELAGVVWGSDDSSGMAVEGDQVADFIARQTGPRPQALYAGVACGRVGSCGSCGGGSCPPVYSNAAPPIQRAPAVRTPAPAPSAAAAAPAPSRPACDCRNTLAALETRLKTLEAAPAVAGPQGPTGPAGPAGPAGKDADSKAIAAAVLAELKNNLPPVNPAGTPAAPQISYFSIVPRKH